MERYFKRKTPLPSDVNAPNTDETPRNVRGTHNIDHTGNIAVTAPAPLLCVSSREVNLDELLYDPVDRKRISEYIGQKLQDEIRQRYLIRGPSRPQPSFMYPQRSIANHMRRFNPEWFNKYDWLEYSEKADGAFCLYCYLFRDCTEGQRENDAFVTHGFCGWNKSDTLRDHVGGCTSLHNTAVKRGNNLVKQDQSIAIAINKQSNITREEHYIRLNTSINAACYLLHQGLAFRGHDESEESHNRGNFLELVKLVAEQNEKVKNVVLRNGPLNRQMASPTIQRDIVNCFAEIIVKSIIEEIEGDVFCLIVDESSDISDKEQMVVVLRYVDKFGLIKERLIGVVHVKETSASCLKSNIDYLFDKYGLSLKQVRGQGYDGASNMRGEFNGLRALITRENNSAYYVHCFAHQLQLVIVVVTKKK